MRPLNDDWGAHETDLLDVFIGLVFGIGLALLLAGDLLTLLFLAPSFVYIALRFWYSR
jgi:hypothetical protein